MYADCKDLAERTVSDKVLKDRAYEIGLNTKYDGYQRGLASIIYKFFGKKIGSGMKSKNGSKYKWSVSQELHKTTIKKFLRGKVYSRFKYDIWAADLVHYHYLLKIEVLNIYYMLDVTKYGQVKPLTDKKAKCI